ncbi:hypothetical protein D1619_18285 [Klebsiella pneumoniae]|nr:hypothetical protein D1619_18285 [Klebsiella pneumoniae]RIV28072.1 hypothetical protein D1623_18375 [Klebsiella pneumoniae]
MDAICGVDSLNRRFNIIYIMRTYVVVAKLRYPPRGCGCFPGLLCCDPKMLPVLHRTHCT